MSETTVLLIEPCDALHAVLAYNLQKRRYLVVRAATAAAAREYFQSRQPADLVLLNTELPDADGTAYAATLNKAHSNLPVILLAPVLTREQVLRVSQARCNGIIALPCTLDDLFDKLNEVLHADTACAPLVIGRYDVLVLRGNLAADFSPRLKSMLGTVLASERTSLVLDMTEVGFLAHQNIVVLTTAACRARKCGKTVALAGANADIIKMLEKAGTLKVFRQCPNRAEALRGA